MTDSKLDTPERREAVAALTNDVIEVLNTHYTGDGFAALTSAMAMVLQPLGGKARERALAALPAIVRGMISTLEREPHLRLGPDDRHRPAS